jgi:hypothetical protein
MIERSPVALSDLHHLARHLGEVHPVRITV